MTDSKLSDTVQLRLRRARTLAVSFGTDGPLVHNFLTRQTFGCSGQALELLAKLEDWHRPDEIFALLPDTSSSSLAEDLAQLLELGGLVVEGSSQDEAGAAYDEHWPWDDATGFYHFAIRDARYVENEELSALVEDRRQGPPSPPLLATNRGLETVHKLPQPDIKLEPMRTMHARRSRRSFGPEALALEDIAPCLFAGLGVTGVYDGDIGQQPFTMTPSGGARNPFELYLYAPRVNGLEPGVYHYSGLDHDLGLVKPGSLDMPGLLAGQQWTGDAAAVIFLVAHFKRSAWKYRQPGAYRVVQIEAGCIAQNILLTATAHELSAAPSGAMYETRVEAALGLEGRPDQAVAFAVMLGTRTEDDIDRLTPLYPA